MKRRVTAMGLAVAALIAGALQLGVDAANSQTPTPTVAPGTSSISGRLYVDVDANGSFGGPDVPLEFPLQLHRVDASGPQPPFLGQNSAGDGTYEFTDLPPGTYELGIQIAMPAGCAVPIAPFTWVGDTFTGLSCPFLHLTTPSRTYVLADGENAAGIDFPEIPHSYDVTARIWLNASPITTNNRVAVTAGENECWTAQVNPTLTAADIPVSFYNASLTPSSNPACHGGDLDITIDGQSASATTPWNVFWRETLFTFGAKPLNKSSDFVNSTDLAVPPFLGISGQVVEARTVSPDGAANRKLVADGTEITAFVGETLCGRTKTKTLTSSTGGFGGNFFGLVVPPADVARGCGTPGASVTFCVGDFKARQPAAGPFSAPGPGTPVIWEAPKRADLTLEPTTEPCVAAEAPLSPVALPPTGGPP